MKICMYIPSLAGGGAERVFVNLANYFVSRGVNVTLISSNLGVYGDQLNPDVKFLRLDNIHFGDSIFKKIGIVVNSIFDIFKLKRILEHEKPDILFSTLALGNIKAYLAKSSRNKKVKLVLRQANVLNTASRNILVNYLIRKSFLKADLIIANSFDTKESILELVDVQDSCKLPIEVIGNPVFDESILLEAEEVIDLSFLRYDSFILNVGRLTKEKDHFSLLEAYKNLLCQIRVDLVILGVGPLKNQIEQKVKELDLEDSVHLRGFTKNPYPYYNKARLFALSSNTEGFGNVLVEALAFNTPIVSTNCKGGPSFILNNGEFGRLVKVGDIQGFTMSLHEELLSSKDWGNSLQDRAAIFSIKNIGNEYFQSFNRLIS